MRPILNRRRWSRGAHKLVNADDMKGAATQCHERLLPAFKAYKGQADKLFEFNMQEGKASGESIMRICSGTQILVVARRPR